MLNWKAYKMPARGKYTYLDGVMKAHKAKVSPDKYAGQPAWDKRSVRGDIHGHAGKDVFRKGKRETFNEETIRLARKLSIPPPGVYDIPKPKI